MFIIIKIYKAPKNRIIRFLIPKASSHPMPSKCIQAKECIYIMSPIRPQKARPDLPLGASPSWPLLKKIKSNINQPSSHAMQPGCHLDTPNITDSVPKC